MSTETHTPGPWFVFGVNGHCVGGPFTPKPGDDPNQQTAGVAMCGMRLRDPHEAAFNARLIAAAPDLLEALRGLVETLKNVDRHHPDELWLGPEFSAAVSAIAKAAHGGT